MKWRENFGNVIPKGFGKCGNVVIDNTIVTFPEIYLEK